MTNRIEEVPVETNEAAVLWLGQNSYVLKSRLGTLFAIDPYLSRDPKYQYIHAKPPISPSKFKVDYIFCTHDHLDHTDPIALPIIAACFPTTIFLGPQESCDHLIELGIQQTRVIPLQVETAYTFSDVQVTPFYSILPSDTTTTHFGYLFSIDNTKIYNMGDTNQAVVKKPEIILNPVAQQTPDIAMFPIIGDTPERRPRDALRFAQIVKPKIAIPCHYDCFTNRTINPQEFTRLLQNDPTMKTVIIPYNSIYIYRP